MGRLLLILLCVALLSVPPYLLGLERFKRYPPVRFAIQPLSGLASIRRSVLLVRSLFLHCRAVA